MITRNYSKELRDYKANKIAESNKGWQKCFAWFPKWVYNENNDYMKIWLQPYWKHLVIYDTENLNDLRGWYYQYKSYDPEAL